MKLGFTINRWMKWAMNFPGLEEQKMTDNIRLDEDQLMALLAAILCSGIDLHPKQAVDSARMILEAANGTSD